LVDRLLASPHYGERWGRHWLDVIRFAESHGYEQNHLRKRAWPFRDYVIRSFNQDKPFSRMVLEQLAGDQIAPNEPEVAVATGFLVAGVHDTVKIENIEGELQKRANELDDMVLTTGAAFLGVTVNCARCHDHKFDPIPQLDYYRMQAAFAGVQHAERDLTTHEERMRREAQEKPLREDLERITQRLNQAVSMATGRKPPSGNRKEIPATGGSGGKRRELCAHLCAVCPYDDSCYIPESRTRSGRAGSLDSRKTSHQRRPGFTRSEGQRPLQADRRQGSRFL
jgi:Protein of unknown function (DUF1549)